MRTNSRNIPAARGEATLRTGPLRPAAAAVCAALLWTAGPAVAGTFRPAPGNGVPEVYIVVLAEGVASTPRAPRPGLPAVAEVARSLGRAHGGRVEEVWEHALQAFVVRMPEARARRLAADPRVAAVEQDFWVSAPVGDCYNGTALANTRTLPSSAASTQALSCSDPDPVNDPNPTGPPLCVDNWGLDRVDQTGGTRDESFSFTNNGSSVHVYVLDSGIRSTHREFLNASGTATRVSGGADARQNPAAPGTPVNTDDCHGHGTHVAGILGGRTYGVAKDALLHPVRTLDCQDDSISSTTFVTRTARALDWIVANVQRPAVVNWSGGNDPILVGSSTLQAAVQGVLASDIVLVQAAGNWSPDFDLNNPAALRDACADSFGGQFPGVIVAAGMDEYEGRWTRRPALDPVDDAHCPPDCGSNAGSCVDIWAPAPHVVSASRHGNDLACQLSGTSMAAPHVAGVVAVYLQSNPNATIAEVERALRSRGTWGALQSDPGDANYIGDHSDNVVVFSDTRAMDSDLPPVATFSTTCAGRACRFDATGSSDDLGIASYVWSFGDGATDTGAVVQHIFPVSFSGHVTLEVTDGPGRTDHLRQPVAVANDVPLPPTNLLATAAGGGVAIAWTPSAGADSYDLERKVAGTPWSVAKTVLGGTQAATNDTPAAPNGVVLYRVVARKGITRSLPSNQDVAWVGTFADDPLLTAAPFTPVKAVHVVQLRQAVNGLRETIGLAPVYAGADLNAAALQGQVVDDSHLTGLLNQLNAARTHVQAGLPPAAFQVPPASGQAVRASQVQDLRNGVK